MQQTLLKIQQRLFSTKLYLQFKEEVRVAEVTGRTCIWVVSRACSIYRKIDFRHVPPAKRGAALEQKLPLISPFKQSGHWVDWQNGYANIWLWDLSVQDRHKEQFANISNEHFESIPESAFADKADDGGRLWQAEDGYIGQYWHDHELVGEGWWPALPTDIQWHNFLKGLSVPIEKRPDATRLIVEGGVRWKSSQHGQVISVANERTAMLSIVSLLVIVAVFQLTSVARLLFHNAAMSSDIEQLRPQAKKTIIQREKFFFLRNQNREYALIAGRTQLELMADVAVILEKSKVRMLLWTYEYPEIEMIIADASPELSNYVKEFEALGWMNDIRIDPRVNRRGITVRASVVADL